MNSFLAYLPGYFFFQKGKILSGSAILLVFFTAILILGTRFEIYFRGLFSLGLHLLLLVINPEEFLNLFNSELIEFWVASMFLSGLIGAIVYLTFMLQYRKKYQTTTGKTNNNLWQIAWGEFKKRTVAVIALGITFVLYSIAFLAPFLAPYPPNSQNNLTVTAYQAPFSTFDVLELNEPLRQNIPLRSEKNFTADLANKIILNNHYLMNRGQTHQEMVVNEYEFKDDYVQIKQGYRSKKIPYTELKHGAAFLQDQSKQPEFLKSQSFILGTDQYGRDILSRVIYGSRISLSIGFLVVFIAVTLGTILGVLSGYFGGFTDNLIMRFVDILIAFPGLFLILIIIATFGNSIYLIVITLSLTGWMGVSRLVRSQILTLKEQEFILAAKALGLKHARIILKHLIPNTLTPVIIAATLRIGSIILTEAGLSFLGLGVQPPTASWGNIINEGRDNLLNHWWISTFPGLAIVLTVVCFNLIGDGARDALDPRMRD